MAIIKQGSTTLNAGAKGDMPSFTINGTTVEDGSNITVQGADGIAIPVTNLTELQAITTNQIASIQSNIDLGTTTLNIPIGVTLRFEGGSIINGTLNGADTYIWAEELRQIFDLTTVFTGTFKFRACYPEWFGGKGDGITENIDFFAKTSEFINTSGGGIIELWGSVYNFSSQNVNGAWNVGYLKGGYEPMIEVGDNTHIISKVSSKIKVVDNAFDVYNIHLISGISGTTITLNTSDGNTQQKSPQVGDMVYISGTYLGTIDSKSTPNYTLDSLAFTPNIGDLMTIQAPANYKIIKFQSAKNSSIKGVVFEGNRQEIADAGDDENLGNIHAVVFYGNCHNITVDNNEIFQIPADAFNASYETNYEGNTKELYESGGINKDTGDNEINSSLIRSELPYRLDRTKILENDRFMMFDQYAYQQINAVPVGKFSVYYYRDGGAYLGCRLDQEMYEYLPVLKDGTGFPADYIKTVIELDDPSRFDIASATGGEQVIPVGRVRAYAIRNSYSDYVWVNDVLQDEGTDYTWTETPDVESILNLTNPLIAGDKLVVSFAIFRMDAKAIEVPTKINIINNTFHDLGRQGISITGFQDLLVDNNVCYNVYGSPGAFIDAEDGEYLNRRLTISNNTVWSCNLGIHLYSVSRVKITGNMFKRANDDTFGAATPLRSLLSYGAPGGDIIVSNNFFEYGVIGVWKGMVFTDNTLEFCSMQALGGVIANNKFNSSSLKISPNINELLAMDKMEIYNNRFLNRPNFGKVAGFTMNILDPLQTPSYFTNNVFLGETSGSDRANFKKGLIVDNVLIEDGSLIVDSPTVNGLKAFGYIDIRYTPLDNEYVTYKNWDIVSSGNIEFKSGATTSLHHFAFDNLTFETPSSSPYMFLFQGDLGSLIFKNSKLIARNGTNSAMIILNNSTKTINKFRMINCEVVTASNGVDLINTGLSTEDATWLYKDNIFTNVILNNALGTELNNFEE